MPKPNLKKAIHTGEFDHLAARSVRLAITNLRLELENVEAHLRAKRIEAHWLSPEEKAGLSPEQIAGRQSAAMLSVQRLNGRWERLTRRFQEAWQVWQKKIQEEANATQQPTTSNH